MVSETIDMREEIDCSMIRRSLIFRQKKCFSLQKCFSGYLIGRDSSFLQITLGFGFYVNIHNSPGCEASSTSSQVKLSLRSKWLED